jgi:predicted nucleic acid-binding protein
MTAYLDSSVLLRHILLGDRGIKQVYMLDEVISSELLDIECRRVLHRYRLQGHLNDLDYMKALERLETVTPSISLLILSNTIKKRAAGAFPVTIKTLDALHIASALHFSETFPGKQVLIYSYDATFNRCARSLGFPAPFTSA